MGTWNLGRWTQTWVSIIFRLHSFTWKTGNSTKCSTALIVFQVSGFYKTLSLNFGGLANKSFFQQMLPTNASLPFRACLRLCSTLLRSNLGIEIRVHFTGELHWVMSSPKVFRYPKCPEDPWDWYIYLYIWLIFMVHVGKYTSPMDPVGSGNSEPYSRLYWGVAFQLTLSRTAYITWGFLHFRYLKCLVVSEVG